MKNNDIVHAKLVKANRDIMGDLESVVIEDDSGKRMTVSIQQVQSALEGGKIEIDGLKIVKKMVKETRRPKNKRPISKYRRELEKILIEIDKYKKSDKKEEKEKYFRLKNKLEELLRQEEYYMAYERIQIDSKKKI